MRQRRCRKDKRDDNFCPVPSNRKGLDVVHVIQQGRIRDAHPEGKNEIWIGMTHKVQNNEKMSMECSLNFIGSQE